MLDILYQWNRWGRATLPSGHPRDVTSRVANFIDTNDIVALVGLRRAGKTTVLFQLMDVLTARGTPEQAILHFNFEEPAIASRLSVELLDEIYQSYRGEVYPVGQAYVFFDEIQNVPGWEKWVRTRSETEDIKIFVTGSSSKLMSRELATVLTGRHIEFYVTPFSFRELVRYNELDIDSHNFNVNPPPPIRKLLSDYMRWGGFPEVVLSEHEERKEILLKQYVDDILFKDVAMRHRIRDINTLRTMAVHLVTQTGCLVSINRLAKLFQISPEMASNYFQFIEESFLISQVPFFSLKTAERNRNPRKVHVNDLGIRAIASLSLSMDYGKLTETLVYQQLQRHYRRDVFYWKGNQEVDFVIRDGNHIRSALQVAYDGLDEAPVLTREMSSLNEIEGQFQIKKSDLHLVVGQLPKKPNSLMIPLWRFLLADDPL